MIRERLTQLEDKFGNKPIVIVTEKVTYEVGFDTCMHPLI